MGGFYDADLFSLRFFWAHQQIAAYHDCQVEEDDWDEGYRCFMKSVSASTVVGCEEKYYPEGTNWASVAKVKQDDVMAGLDWERSLSPLTDVPEEHETW